MLLQYIESWIHATTKTRKQLGSYFFTLLMHFFAYTLSFITQYNPFLVDFLNFWTLPTFPCMYVYMYVCTCVYKYTHTYTDTLIYIIDQVPIWSRTQVFMSLCPLLDLILSMSIFFPRMPWFHFSSQMSCILLCLYTTHLLSVHLDRGAVIWMCTSSLWKAMKMFVCLGVA